MSQLIPSTTPNRQFKDHEGAIITVAVFPDGRRMVTGSFDKTLRLWDLKTGVMLKKMEGHRNMLRILAVSRDGQTIASGDYNGRLIAWHGESGESLTGAIEAHSTRICGLHFSPDGNVLATGSADGTTKLWNTKTWQVQGSPIKFSDYVRCVQYSPSGEHLAIATDSNIHIYNSGTREPVAAFKGNKKSSNLSLAWTPDGTRLLSAGDIRDPSIREWDASTWKQVGDAWTGHTNDIYAIAIHPEGTLVASASSDNHVRLWQLSDQQTIAIFQCSGWVGCITFSMDGKYIFSGGPDNMTSEWKVHKDTLTQEAPKKPASLKQIIPAIIPVIIPAIVPPTIPAINTASNACIVSTEAEEIFTPEVSKLNSVTDTRKLRQQYVTRPEAASVIRKVVDVQLDTAPLRLFNTTTGLLCDREAQISTFKTSAEYKKLLLSTIKHPGLQMEHITEAVATYFHCVMLSHRWEGTELLLHDIQGKVVYKLKVAGGRGVVKLQSFCKIARDDGYHWAWVDTCCIDQNNNVELQKSLNSMFAWYRNSALTVVYLSDVPPSSKPGALAKSTWNTRGWTVPEFLAPKVIRFYQQDWTPYLNDKSPNHKESAKIMHELVDATGIDARALVAFHPGMRNAREKLQWASMRVTTVQEDIAYSLFGIFGVQLPILYGEHKQNALGRLLQEIVARSGDITALDWVGQPSQFNSCLPANISSYAAPPLTLSSLSEDEIQTAVSSLKNTVSAELASNLYDQLDKMSAPRFANCRLHLPCIAFRVTEVRRRRSPVQETHFKYGVKADGLRDLLITTEETLVQFSRVRSIRQTFLLVRPWDRCLLELPDFAEQPGITDDAESSGDWSDSESPLYDSPDGSPVEQEPVDSESLSRALRLIVRLGQPFGAFLLAQQQGGEYKRMASDHDIIAQVKNVASVPSIMDVRTLEIL
ncbi:WD40-repeat-containing domain protein [Suillus ampliporus]|nr:WD40-repeat-containing domain protein [Suillus ampliporus]